MTPQDAWQRIAWFDVETTGLDAERDLLLEGSIAITDAELNVLARETVSIGWTRARISAFYESLTQEYLGLVKGTPWEGDLRRPVDVMAISSAERRALGSTFLGKSAGVEQVRLQLLDRLQVREQHEKSGLWEACSESRVTLEEADDRLLDVLCLGRSGTGLVELPLGGCSPFLDRAIAARDLPRLSRHLSRRTVDVSCLRNALRSWAGVYPEPAVKYGHRAEADVTYAIELAKRLRGWIQRGAKLVAQDDERRVRVAARAVN